jgi:hypothetical protein
MPENSSIRAGLIMLTWNQREMTREGLSSLAGLRGSFHPLLVDNGSVDGTVEAVRAQFPGVEILALPENLGFCAANNRGAELLLKNPGLDFFLFLNNDIEIAPDALQHLIAFMDAHPQAGACGPMIYYHEAPATIWAAGGRIFNDLSWFPPILRGKPDPGYIRPQEVDYIHGCALMVRREVIESLGGFDERMFIYHDEVDWCLRMKKAGYSVWLVPRAKLWHKVTQAVGQHSPMMIYYTARNKLLFWWKHGRLKDLPKFYAFHLWKALRIFGRTRNPWAFAALGKACLDAAFGWFGRGHIDRARKS